VLHRDPSTHALLYRLLWRITHGERGVLDDAADPDVRTIAVRAKQVRNDIHRMHAFVRFRLVETDQGEHYIAWHAPDHFVLPAAAPFFVERFGAMRWSILTPDASAHWDRESLTFGPGVPRHQAPTEDALEDLWRTYYASTFNPARVNPKLHAQHVPARFRAAMPESSIIPALLEQASTRVDAMVDHAAAYVPATTSLPVLRDAARACMACELCGPATQTVFGEGPADARLVLVGEQPGDKEDLAGRPFIGPAGAVLDAALADAGIDRSSVYLTNAVKHFRFLPRGKTRLHQRPTADQIRTCKPWVAAELRALQPQVVVCLGATAAQSLVGSRFRITQERGRVLTTSWADHLIATHHPAAILRVEPDLAPRYEAELRADLRAAAALLRA
jgi:DNA polymerase